MKGGLEVALRMESAQRSRDALVFAFPAEVARRRARRARMLARRRRTAGILVALAAAGGLWWSAPEPGLAARGRAGTPSVVVVGSRQTLWGLAVRYGSPGMDRRAYVAAIERANGIDGPLEAGTRVRLPQ
jgi:hypothetical protein